LRLLRGNNGKHGLGKHGLEKHGLEKHSLAKHLFERESPVERESPEKF
jgi:hypothetical protein